jgi:hypothetical protein
MKVTVKHINSMIPEDEFEFYDDFISFLQKEYPLKTNITIKFLGQKNNNMSTGSRSEKHILNVLAKGRMNRDILRTLAHEWIHEYQRDVLNRERGGDIGSKNENEANSGAGIVIKKFELKNPHLEGLMYE